MAENKGKSLFIYELLNNVNAQVFINGLSKDIVAYTTQDFGFSAAAQWSGRNPNAYMNMANAMESGGKELYNRTLGRKYGEMATGMTLDIAGSLLNYQGTEPFGFTLNLYFIAIKADDDVRERIGYLSEGLFPSFPDVAGVKNFRLEAPNKYKRGASISEVSGAVSIRIGKWFETLQIFVINNLDFNISKETIPSGLPLYANGSVSFKASRILSIREVKSMFKLGGQ